MILPVRLVRWSDAINSQNISLIENVYSEKAILLPTLSDDIKVGYNKIIPYFRGLFKKKNLKVDFEEIKIQTVGNVHLFSGNYVFSFDNLLSMRQNVPARYVFVFNGNKIINHQSSIRHKF